MIVSLSEWTVVGNPVGFYNGILKESLEQFNVKPRLLKPIGGLLWLQQFFFQSNGNSPRGIEMVIKAEVHIRAPIATVWRIFSQLDRWKDWNRACESCRFTSEDHLVEGACFSFVPKPFIFPLKVEPRVVSCDPGRRVVWEGKRLGISAVHAWQFQENADGVRLERIETFRGPSAADRPLGWGSTASASANG